MGWLKIKEKKMFSFNYVQNINNLDLLNILWTLKNFQKIYELFLRPSKTEVAHLT